MKAVLRALTPYAVAILVVVLIVGIKKLIPFGDQNPYLLFTLCVIFVASRYGFVPGLFAVAVAMFAGDFFFVRPLYRFGIAPSDVQRALEFGFQNLLISGICGVMIKAQRDRAEAVAEQQTSLLEIERTTRALRESEQLYLGAIEAIPQGVFVADPQFEFEWVNDRWTDQTGVRFEESLGDGWRPALDPGDLALVVHAVERIEPASLEVRLRDPDGSLRWQLLRAVPVPGPDGRLRHWIGSFTDIHERKLVEQNLIASNEALELGVRERAEQLAATNRNLEAANEELEAFCYAVSHDLRTPLRAVDGFAKALLDDHGELLPDEGRGYLDRVRAGTRRMDELITALLKLSRIARQEVSPIRVDLSEIAASVWRDLDPELVAKASFELAPDMLAKADRKLARVVFDNLLSNALKFSARSPAPSIVVGLAETDRGEAFFVRDNGVGFNAAYESKLFSPFERLHSARDYPGSGIGLATVMRIVRKHGGDAWARSAEGEGATFFFTFAAGPAFDVPKPAERAGV